MRARQDDDPARLVAGRDPEFHRWMGEGSPDPRPFAVIEVDGAVAGWVDHDRDATRTWLAPDQCNVGYHVLAAQRGRGIARRAVALLLGLLAQEGRYREATFLVDAENHASLAVARAVSAREVRRLDVDGRPQVLLAVVLD